MIPTPIQVAIKNTPGAKIVVNLSLRNHTRETLLLRPTVEDWVVDQNQILSIESQISPPFVALHSQGETRQSITLQLPSDLQPQQTLRSWLRYPGLHEHAIPFQIEIVPLEKEKYQAQVVEVQITFPPDINVDRASHSNSYIATGGVYWLLPVLMDLDKIPSRWLVAELLLKAYQQGEKFRTTISGIQMSTKLLSTSFFKEGVLAFAAAQLPRWISDTISIEKQVLGVDNPSKGKLLYIWERCLWSLVDKDIEFSREEQLQKPFTAAEDCEPEEFEIESDIEHLFANILLGLAQISPTTMVILNKIIFEVPLSNEQSNKQTEKTVDVNLGLTAGLHILDTLPARWLVVELCIVLAQIGETYATTKPGEQLLNQLSRTRFFKNGVLTLASANVPRWLHVSQAAASAYHVTLGYSKLQGGLIYTAEQWLFSLMLEHVELVKNDHLTTDDKMDAFVKKLGMDSDRWFGFGMLGLAQVSPRIAALLQTIASKAPKQDLQESSPQLQMEDILGEINSLYR